MEATASASVVSSNPAVVLLAAVVPLATPRKASGHQES